MAGRVRSVLVALGESTSVELVVFEEYERVAVRGSEQNRRGRAHGARVGWWSHPSQSRWQTVEQLDALETSKASNFLSRAEAEAAVISNMDHNAAKVQEWLRNCAVSRLRIEVPFSGGLIRSGGADLGVSEADLFFKGTAKAAGTYSRDFQYHERQRSQVT